MHVKVKHSVEQLAALVRKEKNARVATRLRAVRGRTHKEIAANLAVGARSVQEWIQRYNTGGVESLRDRTRPGQAGGITFAKQRWALDSYSCLYRAIRIAAILMSWASVTRDSNITEAADAVHPGFDALYAMEGRNRLIREDEGTLSSHAITAKTRGEVRTLSQPGNRANHKLDLDADSVYTSGGELNDTETFNTVNELMARCQLSLQKQPRVWVYGIRHESLLPVAAVDWAVEVWSVRVRSR